MHNHNQKITSLALLSASILLVLLALAGLFRADRIAATAFTIAIIFYEISVPIEILKYFKIDARTFNIYAHDIDTLLDVFFPPFGFKKIRPDFTAIVGEMLSLLKVMALVFIPYIFCYWAFFKARAILGGDELLISFELPSKLGFEVLAQVFVVALPEELYFRGFLQSALLNAWPNRFKLLGMPLGFAILLTNLIFALAHFVGSLDPMRLLTFFPGLIFSYLVYKNNSLLSAVLFHAACNILGQILFLSIA